MPDNNPIGKVGILQEGVSHGKLGTRPFKPCDDIGVAYASCAEHLLTPEPIISKSLLRILDRLALNLQPGLGKPGLTIRTHAEPISHGRHEKGSRHRNEDLQHGEPPWRSRIVDNHAGHDSRRTCHSWTLVGAADPSQS